MRGITAHIRFTLVASQPPNDVISPKSVKGSSITLLYPVISVQIYTPVLLIMAASVFMRIRNVG